MAAPQRVNVLLSRARNALIIIGNADTFMKSRKGRDVWIPLMDQLKKSGHIYDGFPVKCEQHPEKTALLAEKEHFDSICPDGGCSEPWSVADKCTIAAANSVSGKMLNCQTHTCPQRCHQLQDHSKMDCKAIISSKCSKGHTVTRKCHDKAAATCQKCEAEVRAQEKKRQRDYKLDQERQKKQREYAARLAEVEDEIEHQKRILKDQAEERDRQQALAQKKQDLSGLKAKAKEPTRQPDVNNSSTKSSSVMSENNIPSQNGVSTPQKPANPPNSSTSKSSAATTSEHDGQPDGDKSEAKDDWEWQKKYEGAENEALNSLISMTGNLNSRSI